MPFRTLSLHVGILNFGYRYFDLNFLKRGSVVVEKYEKFRLDLVLLLVQDRRNISNDPCERECEKSESNSWATE